MPKSPVIFKIKFYSPRTKTNAQQCNAAHVIYIATRPGVDKGEMSLDEGVSKELEMDTAAGHVKYAAERPGSHGLFGAGEADSDIDAVAGELKKHNGIVWRAIISLKEEEAIRLQYDNKEQWQTKLRIVMPDIARSMGIVESNLRWTAAFHVKKGHPHVHFVFWEKKPQRLVGMLKKNERREVKRLITREIFAEERALLNQQKTGLRDLINDIAKKDMIKALDLIREVKSLDKKGVKINTIAPTLRRDKEDELINKIQELSLMMPGKGRISFAYMPQDVKVKVREIADYILKQPHFIVSVKDYKSKAREIASYYTKNEKQLKEAEDKAYEDLRDRTSQVILKAAAESLRENAFVLDEDRAVCAIQAIKELDQGVNDKYEKQEVARKYLSTIREITLDDNKSIEITKKWVEDNGINISKNDLLEEMNNAAIKDDDGDGEALKHKIMQYTSVMKASGFNEEESRKVITEKLVSLESSKIGAAIEKLKEGGYISDNGDGYIITEKLAGDILSIKHLNKEERAICDVIKDKETFAIDDLIQEKSIIETLKAPDRNQGEIVFGKYDANVIFKMFNKDDKSITLEDLQNKLAKRYRVQDEAEKQFEIISARIGKLAGAGYIDKLEDGITYRISEKGIQEAKAIGTKFEFTSFDAGVVFRYIDKAGGRLSEKALKELLCNEYEDKEYIENQFKYLKGRIDKNIAAGYLVKEGEHYSKTDSGIKECNKILSNIINKVTPHLKYFERLGVIKSDTDGRYRVIKRDDLKNLLESRDRVKSSVINKDIYNIIDQNKGVLSESAVKTKVAEKVNEGLQDFKDIHPNYQSIRKVLKVEDAAEKAISEMSIILFSGGCKREEVENLVSSWNDKTGTRISQGTLIKIVNTIEKKAIEANEWGRKLMLGFHQWKDFFKRLDIPEDKMPGWMYKGINESKEHLAHLAGGLWKAAWRGIEREKVKNQARTERLRRRLELESSHRKSGRSIWELDEID